ncbi:hypothetical protein [Azospirillum melinis]
MRAQQYPADGECSPEEGRQSGREDEWAAMVRGRIDHRSGK